MRSSRAIAEIRTNSTNSTQVLSLKSSNSTLE